jgi:alpha-beta hydrolase superfamily lysophospholipase
VTAPAATESFVTSRDGTRLRTVAWQPPPSPAARLLFVHGWAEHADRYGFPAAYFTARGYACSGVDVRGHGGSAGRRGYIDRYAEYLDDVEAALAALPGPGDVPTFLVGHSQGGLVCTRLVEARGDLGLAGLVLSSPFFALNRPLSAVERFMSARLSRIWPALPIPSGLDTKDLTHDEAVVRAYEDDPLVFRKPVVRWAAESLAAQEAALAEASYVKLPCLVMHGAADRIASPPTTQRFFEACGAADKELKLWDGLYHEIFNELDREQVFALVDRWCRAHGVAG